MPGVLGGGGPAFLPVGARGLLVEALWITGRGRPGEQPRRRQHHHEGQGQRPHHPASPPRGVVLLAFEGRLQFHGADKSGNKNQTVVAELNGNVLSTIVVPFGWKNTWSAKVGFEYRFTKDLLALRLGANIAESAATGAFSQYFTPPPGLSGYLSVGLGFYWDDRNDPSIKDKYRLDLAGAFAFTTGNIGNEYIGTSQPVPGTSETVNVCTDEQVVRTGCPGDYKALTYWASFSFTLQY